MSNRHFYFWMIWHLFFLCVGAINIYRYIVTPESIGVMICGCVVVPFAIYGLFRVIEMRYGDDKKGSN